MKLLIAAGLLATVLIQEKGNGIILRVKNSKTKLNTYVLGKSFAIMFLKIKQLNKVSTLEVVQLVRDSVHTICDVCDKQTRRVFQLRYFSG